jgi:hypothetical protein
MLWDSEIRLEIDLCVESKITLNNLPMAIRTLWKNKLNFFLSSVDAASNRC